MDDQSPEGRAAIFDLLTDMQATFTRLENLHSGHHGHPWRLHRRRGWTWSRRAASATPRRMRSSASREINIGMVADVGTLQRLPKLIPLGVVKELAYTGRRLSARQGAGLRPGQRIIS